MESRTVQTNQEIKRIWERHRNQVIATGNMNKENTPKSSTKQVELSNLKEEIK